LFGTVIADNGTECPITVRRGHQVFLAVGGWRSGYNPQMVAQTVRLCIVALGTGHTLLPPGQRVRWSGINATVLPTSQSARIVSGTIARQFPPASNATPIIVVASAPASAQSALASYTSRLARLPGIAKASGPVELAPGTWEIRLASPADPISSAGQRAVTAVRALPAPVPVLVVTMG
jgi:hypothetical protein